VERVVITLSIAGIEAGSENMNWNLLSNKKISTHPLVMAVMKLNITGLATPTHIHGCIPRLLLFWQAGKEVLWNAFSLWEASIIFWYFKQLVLLWWLEPFLWWSLNLITTVFTTCRILSLCWVELSWNYIEVEHLGRATTTTVMKSLKIMFSRYGIPDVGVSDKGPQF